VAALMLACTWVATIGKLGDFGLLFMRGWHHNFRKIRQHCKKRYTWQIIWHIQRVELRPH